MPHHTIPNHMYTHTAHRWPELVPTLLAQVVNPDVLKVYNALLALRKLVKRYEYKAK
jgi:hypothetical protein